MRKANFKGKCQKRSLTKCKDVCRTYDDIQSAYADVLEQREDIVDFSCNVLLDGLDIGAYTSDFVCTKANGEIMVIDCLNLTMPQWIEAASISDAEVITDDELCSMTDYHLSDSA